MTREEIIEKLVDNAVDNVLSGGLNAWVRDIFKNGIEGYNSMSNDDLLCAYEEEIDDSGEVEIID